MRGQYSYNFRYGGHLQRGPDDEDQVHKIPVVLHQPVVEGGWEVLAEECDVRLHDSRNRNVVVLIIRTIFVAWPFLPRNRRPVGASFPLESGFGLSYGSDTSVATRYLSGFQILVYVFALDFVFTLKAGCSGKRSMTLN